MNRRQVVRTLTQVVNRADAAFLQYGPDHRSRTWVERWFLPILDEQGLIVAPATADSPGRPNRTTARKPRRRRR